MADIMPNQTIAPGFDPAFSEAEGMIAPGQEEMAQKFMDGEPEAESKYPHLDQKTDAEKERLFELIGGKFKTQEDLLNAYQELERKQSQPADQAQSQGYTAEQAADIYGDDIVNSVTEAGLSMADLMWQADNGGDISEHYDALASAVGVPRQVVENYVSKAQSGGGEESVGMSEVEEAQIMDEVGGQGAFQELSGWAKTNLDPAELSDYNGIVDSGNKQAIRWALKAMQARSNSGAPSEPKLIRGQAPATQAQKFNSQSEVLEAMNKRDSRGRKLYETDSEYQRKFAELLNNSDVFG